MTVKPKTECALLNQHQNKRLWIGLWHNKCSVEWSLATKERAKQSLSHTKYSFPTHVTHMTREK